MAQHNENLFRPPRSFFREKSSPHFLHNLPLSLLGKRFSIAKNGTKDEIEKFFAKRRRDTDNDITGFNLSTCSSSTHSRESVYTRFLSEKIAKSYKLNEERVVVSRGEERSRLTN